MLEKKLQEKKLLQELTACIEEYTLLYEVKDKPSFKARYCFLESEIKGISNSYLEKFNKYPFIRIGAKIRE